MKGWLLVLAVFLVCVVDATNNHQHAREDKTHHLRNAKSLKERFEAWRTKRNVVPTTEEEKKAARENAKDVAEKVLNKIKSAKEEQRNVAMKEKLAALKEARKEKLQQKFATQTEDERRAEVVSKVKNGREKLMSRLRTLKDRADSAKAAGEQHQQQDKFHTQGKRQFNHPHPTKEDMQQRREQYKQKLEDIRKKIAERKAQHH